MGKRLRRWFNVRSDEAPLVSSLFALQLSQGAGLALFYTSAFTAFLHHLGSAAFPQVYFLSAILLWITGFVYSRIEHHFSFRILLPLLLSLILFSIAAFTVGAFFIHAAWFDFIQPAWYYVIYLIGNLMFWGLSSQLFDTRQSKRLFGVISAGDIPAKFLGYMSALLIVPVVGTQSLLVASLICFSIALILAIRMRRSGYLDLDKSGEHSDSHSHEEESIPALVRGFASGNLIRDLALLALLVGTCTYLINFVFYAEVKERLSEDNALAQFISSFMAVGTLLSVILKLAITGRISEKIGVKGALLIMPLILSGFLLSIWISHFIGVPVSLLYAFGMMNVLSDTLKLSIQDPVFIAMMQPLKKSQRLIGHNIIKGITDPFAIAMAGAVAAMVLHEDADLDTNLLLYVLSGALLLWIAWVFFVDRSYIRMLVHSIRNRYRDGQEIDLSDEQNLHFIEERLKHAESGEALYLLQILSGKDSNLAGDLVLLALRHSDRNVQMQAMDLCEQMKLEAAKPLLKEMQQGCTDNVLLSRIIKVLCALQDDDADEYYPYLDHPDRSIEEAAVSGLLRNGGINSMVTAGQKLIQWTKSSVKEDRQMSARIIGELGIRSFYRSLEEHLSDPEAAVMEAAILAAGQIAHPNLIPRLLALSERPEFSADCMRSLIAIGAPCVSGMVEKIGHRKRRHFCEGN